MVTSNDKTPKKTCDTCIHMGVCTYRLKLVQCLSAIIQLKVGGRNLQWREAQAFIAKICRFGKFTEEQDESRVSKK